MRSPTGIRRIQKQPCLVQSVKRIEASERANVHCRNAGSFIPVIWLKSMGPCVVPFVNKQYRRLTELSSHQGKTIKKYSNRLAGCCIFLYWIRGAKLSGSELTARLDALLSSTAFMLIENLLSKSEVMGGCLHILVVGDGLDRSFQIQKHGRLQKNALAVA